MAHFLLYAVLTILLEMPVLALFGYRRPDQLILCAAVNAATNITLNVFILNVIPVMLLGIEPAPMDLYLAEAGIVLIEFAAYALAYGHWQRALLASLAANTFSFGAGLVITNIL